MRLVQTSISPAELKKMSEKMYGGLVKAVVDIDKNLFVVDADLHADQEAFLIECGSLQEHLWGINIYPDNLGTDNWIEFDSMINIRPVQGNRSRSVEDNDIRAKIVQLVQSYIV